MTKPFRHRSKLERAARRAYVRWVRPQLTSVLAQQRAKLVAWDMWGYAPLLAIPTLPVTRRARMVAQMLRIDWNVPHAHKPREAVAVLRSIAQRKAQPGEIVIEAGCWMGGSTAKFSVFCREFGFQLHVYDSFEGVEARTAAEGDAHDFSGGYSAQLDSVREHVRRYGAVEVCEFHKGWFADTLVVQPPTKPVRGAYIDCDLVKGTREVLGAVVPKLVADGWVYSQDFHIEPVRQLVASEETWRELGRPRPAIQHVYRNLARII